MPTLQDFLDFLVGTRQRGGTGTIFQKGLPGPADPLANPNPQGGLFGAPGSFMQALGVPLALAGAVELARGKPVGAAYLGGPGALLTYLGGQRSDFAGQQEAARDAMKVARQRGIFKSSPGLEQTLSGMIGSDPGVVSSQVDDLTKFFESRQPKEIKYELKQLKNGQVAKWNPFTGVLEPLPGGEKLEHFPTNELQQIIMSHADWAGLPEDQQLAMGIAEQTQRKKDIARAGAQMRSDIETAATGPRATARAAAEAPFKAPKIAGYDPTKVEGGFVYRPSAVGITGSVTSALKKPFFMRLNDPKRYYPGDFVPGKGVWYPD